MNLLARFCAAVAVALAAPLAATPPDVVSVHDSAFAVDDTSIYLLRRTDDNLGLHTATRSEVFLVRVDAASGLEEVVPVHSEDSNFEWFSDTQIKRSVTPNRTPEMVDPFAYVAEAGATLLGWNPRAAEAYMPPLERTGEAVVLRHSEERSHTLAVETAHARARAAMQVLADEVGGRPRYAGQTTGEFYMQQAASAGDCSIGAESWPARTATGMVQLFRVTCRDEEMGNPVLSILVPVAQDR